MPHQFIQNLAHQEQIDQIYLASGKQLRPNRNGQLYLQVDLSDRSGTLSGRLWNAQEGDGSRFEDGDFVRVRGTAQLYQGAMQLILSDIQRANSADVDWNNFSCLTPADVDKLARRLAELLRGLKDPGLRALAECFLGDEAFMASFSRCPAGVKNHHAYQGGLLEHVVNLMEVANRIYDRYPQLNHELLLFGCFLHDMGKIEELSFEKGFAYTDAGQLLGHVVQGISLLDEKIRQAEELLGEPISGETILRLKHMILSHHGEYQYGSPKLPMTLEAVALHYLDNLDARLHNFQQLLRDEANVESSWTMYHPSLGRKIFKGRVKE
ncbi:MAG: HD domain-containing protein [Pirellulales bacterium]|nr:HD domain-containing protein [Pirellulales bacterium]